MNVGTVSELFNSLGMAGVFIGACWYLMKRMEAQAVKIAQEAREREDRLIRALETRESYIHSSLATALADSRQSLNDSTKAMENSAQAMRDVAHVLEALPCRHEKEWTGKERRGR